MLDACRADSESLKLRIDERVAGSMDSRRATVARTFGTYMRVSVGRLEETC